MRKLFIAHSFSIYVCLVLLHKKEESQKLNLGCMINIHVERVILLVKYCLFRNSVIFHYQCSPL